MSLCKIAQPAPVDECDCWFLPDIVRRGLCWQLDWWGFRWVHPSPAAKGEAHPQPPLSAQCCKVEGGCCQNVGDRVCLQSVTFPVGRHVDNELAFFSVYSDSSMDMFHLTRYTHDNITSGSEINIDTQVPYSMLDRSLHVHIPLWGAKRTPQAAVRWSGIIHPHRQESTIVACMETSMYNYMHTRNGVYITELHRELQAKVQYCILTKYSHFQTATPC